MNNFLSHTFNKVATLSDNLANRINSCSDSRIVAGISLVYFTARILFLQLFETSGDAVWKWSFLRYFYETGVWFPRFAEHHQGRWAQNIPVYSLMKLFNSSSPWIGSIIPVLSGFAVLLLVWLIARLFTSKTGAVVAVMLTAINPIFVNESAQYLPSLPATMYVLLTIYLLLLYIRKPTQYYLALIAGFTLGLAWGCKVTVVYWALGMGLFMMLNSTGGKDILTFKKIRIGWDVVLFSIGFLLVFIPETIVINDLFELKLGRFDMLKQHHGDNPKLVCFNLLEYIFSPFVIFLNLSGKFVRKGLMAALFMLSMPIAVYKICKKDTSLHKKFLLFAMFTALICHCYFVVKFFPFKHPERPLTRYFLTLFCVWNIIIVSDWRCIFEIKRKTLQRILLAAFCFLFALTGILSLANIINIHVLKGNNLFAKINSYRYMALHRKDNTTILVRYEKGRYFKEQTLKVIIACNAFFGDTGKLPELQRPDVEKLKQEWLSRKPVQDKNGDLFFHLCGKKTIPGTSEKCIIVEKDSVQLKEITFANNTYNNKKQ